LTNSRAHIVSRQSVSQCDGRYARLMTSLAKVDVLILDDWGLALLDDERRRDLLVVLDERYEIRSTIITSQLPIATWHDALGDPTLADTILDRLVHHAHPLNLDGESLRRLKPKLTEEPNLDETSFTPCVASLRLSTLPWTECPVSDGMGVQFVAGFCFLDGCIGQRHGVLLAD
jgi:IstB-like ATP binding protein